MHGAVPLLHDYLTHAASRVCDKVALVCGGQRVTYGELEARSNAIAQHLASAGVARGDRVMIFADNTVETVVAFWAVLKANAVVCIVNPLTKSDKLDYLLNDCRPTALITDRHLHSIFSEPARNCPSLRRVIVSGPIIDTELAGLPHAVRWDSVVAADGSVPPARRCIDIDLAAIIYTSGSTGEPKGVMLTHRNMTAACTSIASYLKLCEDEVILNVLPLAFDYGLYQMIMAFRTGARLVLERSFAFPAQILGLIKEERVTGFPGVPTIFAALSDLKSLKDHDFSSIRYVTNTAAALPLKHILMLQDLFPDARIYSMYGLTECKRCTYLPPEDLERKPLSVGVAIPNTEMWIVDEHDKPVGPDVVGQLVIRGATVMKGYWGKPEATARKLKPGPLPGEQVLYTGDYCRMDAEGYLYFIGRGDEIIKSRGEKIAPKEVENALLDIPGVREAAVIGVPDELLGQAVKAFVVIEQGRIVGERQLQKECQRRLENFMVPKSIVIVPSLPMTDTGKLKKTALS
ncbi:MAG: AMP-dependent synthetase [Mesorhizobium sp.]|nr:MAG: AMP-dependent synthetase [Mesorhizobium sp.]TGT94942.1 AMP-dependent synthetase [Mesorhizobium sp. M5C.F.Ca.ET.164.01.1.1]RWB79322.1 MAG: AMP-dependent synthetase [Mesorhizobium sp.]RWC24544.1 MAG: AMP-dependent synthetase [Mesorhizobium sp.]RWD22240.1 MAG: AMP-dependent synthetase [Mesorhizobium sp.]